MSQPTHMSEHSGHILTTEVWLNNITSPNTFKQCRYHCCIQSSINRQGKIRTDTQGN